MLVVLDTNKMGSTRKGSVNKKRSGDPLLHQTDEEKEAHVSSRPKIKLQVHSKSFLTESVKSSSKSDSDDMENVVHLGIFNKRQRDNPLVTFKNHNKSRNERSNSQTITYTKSFT